MNLIQTLEAEEIARAEQDHPEFAPGDTVIVSVNVVEGNRKRIAGLRRRGDCQTQSRPEQQLHRAQDLERRGVERTFQTYSPLIAGIEVNVVTCAVPNCTTCVTAAASRHVSGKAAFARQGCCHRRLRRGRPLIRKPLRCLACSGFRSDAWMVAKPIFWRTSGKFEQASCPLQANNPPTP